MNIEEILNNEDCISIANKAAIPFMNSLSQDEINYCIANAAWNSVKSFNPDKNVKLLTYLYRGVVIECTKHVKSNINKNKLKISPSTKGLYIASDNRNDIENIDMLDEIKNCEDPSLMYRRFYENKTLNELAKEENLTKEAIRLRIQKNLKIIKSRIDSGV